MKKVLLFAMLLVCGVMATMAQKPAEIKFDKVKHNFGTFLEKDGVQTCTFAFTNVGEEPLVINQAMPSCGCTVPSYSKEPIMPGQKGEIKVSYNGRGKSYGYFSKKINVRTNGVPELTVLEIEGEMLERER